MTMITVRTATTVTTEYSHVEVGSFVVVMSLCVGEFVTDGDKEEEKEDDSSPVVILTVNEKLLKIYK